MSQSITYSRFNVLTEIKSICVYCGSQPGNDPAFVETAVAFGATMARHNIDLVYGAGANGIMGAVARAVRENGGRVTGVIPEFLMEHEANSTPEDFCDRVLVTQNMHERKQLMFEHADAFVTLPGGIGTLEEIIEMMTWAQLGRHTKPMCFLDVANFWHPLFDLMDHMREAGFIHTAKLVQPKIATDPEEVIQLLSS